MAVSRSFSDIKQQVLATFVVNIIVFGFGGAVGWYSPALPYLQSVRTPLLDGPLSAQVAGWIGAFLPFGAIFGGLILGFIANSFGVKLALILHVLPLTISWLAVYFGHYGWHLYVARFFAGSTGGGLFVCVPLFVVEIASDNIRGTLNSYLQVSCYSGVLFGFITGAFVNYDYYPMIMLVFPTVFFAVFIFFHDTPQQLLKQNRLDAAESSLRFYRNAYNLSAEREREFQDELWKLQEIAKQNTKLPALRVADFLEPKVRNNILNGSLLISLSHLCGTYVLCNYAATIFTHSGSTVDPFLSSIIMASMQVLGVFSASTLIDRFGRKVLLLVSAGGASCFLLLTGLYAYAAKTEVMDVSSLNFVPLVGLSMFIFVSAIGMLPVPFVYVAEIFPQRLRRIGCTLCTMFISLVAIGQLKFFPLLLTHIELHGCMFVFAGVALFGLVYISYIVQETKGKDVNVLEKSGEEVVEVENKV